MYVAKIVTSANIPFSRRDVIRTTVGGIGVAGLGGSAAGTELVEVNVGYRNTAGQSAAKQAASDVKREFGFDAITIRAAPAAAENLANNPNIRYVEENGTMYALDQTTPYGIEITDGDLAIDDGNTGDGVSIAVLDTGIDAQHETLEGNLGEGWATEDAACTTDCGGGPFGGGNDISECLEEWDDDNDHGTHCAGTAAAADNGTGVLGVAPDATLHAVKVLACDGSGSFDDIAAGIEWSADQGHDVQSMSLGADSDSDVVTDALQYAADQGVVMIAAAGNDGPCTDCVGFPARDERVIAVSATDENDDLADFSSTGPEVDLAAPGVGTLSTVPRDDYAEFSGTSMACPHVSGAAATLIADGTTDRETVRQELKEAADDIDLDDNEQGDGRLNVAAAVGSDDEEDDGDGEEEEDDEEESVSVVTEEASDVGETAATLNGEVTALENADEADVGFEYGESGGDLANTVGAGTVSGTEAFDATVDDLDADTEYEFRAVAETTDAEGEGGIEAFRTDESDTGDSAPVIDQFDVSDDSNPNWTRHTVEWSISDDNGDLDVVTSEQLDGDSVVDSASTDVSGGSADGVHDLESRRTAVGEIRLTVVDEAGNETSETREV